MRSRSSKKPGAGLLPRWATVLVLTGAASLAAAPALGASRSGPSVGFKLGNYHGTSTQGLSVSFRASKTVRRRHTSYWLTHITFQWIQLCTAENPDGSTYQYTRSGQTSGLPPMPIAYAGARYGGAFHGHIVWQGHFVSFAGRLSHSNGSGVLNATGPGSCSTAHAQGSQNGEIHWSAHHA